MAKKGISGIAIGGKAASVEIGTRTEF